MGVSNAGVDVAMMLGTFSHIIILTQSRLRGIIAMHLVLGTVRITITMIGS